MSYLIADETRLHVAGGNLYRLQFAVENRPTPPWEDEGGVPVVWYSGRDKFRTEGMRGYDLLNPVRFLSDRTIKAKLGEIVRLIPASGCNGTLYETPESFDEFVRGEYPHLSLCEARREWIENYLGDGESSQGRIKTLAAFWTLAGVPAIVGESRGYSQGDWAAVLAVAHPDAVKAWGFKTMRDYRKACFGKDEKDLRDAVRLWGAWCWGGVIGYDVALISPDEMKLAGLTVEDLDAATLNGLAYCEDVDSCGGFYPDHGQDYFPLDKNHAYTIECAVEAANSDATHRTQGVAA